MTSDHPSLTPLELTRESFAAADSGDFERMISFYGPESVFDMSEWGLGVHMGLPAIRTFFEAWIGSFVEFEMKLEEMDDLGGGVVFAVARQTARQARSRTPLRLQHAAIAVWGDGVARRVTNYRDIERAREIAEHASERSATRESK